jgi:hypothetical protein
LFSFYYCTEVEEEEEDDGRRAMRSNEVRNRTKKNLAMRWRGGEGGGRA